MLGFATKVWWTRNLRNCRRLLLTITAFAGDRRKSLQTLELPNSTCLPTGARETMLSGFLPLLKSCVAGSLLESSLEQSWWQRMLANEVPSLPAPAVWGGIGAEWPLFPVLSDGLDHWHLKINNRTNGTKVKTQNGWECTSEARTSSEKGCWQSEIVTTAKDVGNLALRPIMWPGKCGNWDCLAEREPLSFGARITRLTPPVWKAPPHRASSSSEFLLPSCKPFSNGLLCKVSSS